MEGRGSMDLAAVYSTKGELAEALSALRRASELAEALGDTEACGECYTRLGGLHLLRAEPAEAAAQLQRAVGVWQSRADEITSAMIERRHELGLQVCDEPELVMLYDDHADTFTLLASALLAAAPPARPRPPTPRARCWRRSAAAPARCARSSPSGPPRRCALS